MTREQFNNLKVNDILVSCAGSRRKISDTHKKTNGRNSIRFLGRKVFFSWSQNFGRKWEEIKNKKL